MRKLEQMRRERIKDSGASEDMIKSAAYGKRTYVPGRNPKSPCLFDRPDDMSSGCVSIHRFRSAYMKRSRHALAHFTRFR